MLLLIFLDRCLPSPKSIYFDILYRSYIKVFVCEDIELAYDRSLTISMSYEIWKMYVRMYIDELAILMHTAYIQFANSYIPDRDSLLVCFLTIVTH